MRVLYRLSATVRKEVGKKVNFTLYLFINLSYLLTYSFIIGNIILMLMLILR